MRGRGEGGGEAPYTRRLMKREQTQPNLPTVALSTSDLPLLHTHTHTHT